jgi:hypothetical protein
MKRWILRQRHHAVTTTERPFGGQGAERLFTVLGVVVIVAIAWFSLIPQTIRPDVGLSGHVEHIIAYFSAAFLLGMAYGQLTQLAAVAFLLWSYGGFLELGQFMSPGRTPRISDWMVDGVGCVAGIAVAMLLYRLLRLISADS